MYQDFFISVILCAGGTGTRMGAAVPKQYLPLDGKPIALYSFELFAKSPEIDEIIVVCDPSYQPLFRCNEKSLRFALPGKRRQDSVYAGLLKTAPQADFVLTHDAARPFLKSASLTAFLQTLVRADAAALAAPVTSTIKQCLPCKKIEKTIDRSCLWEMQTPQGMRRSLFFQALEHIHRQGLEVTDDMALAEAMGYPAEIVPSCATNFKITTPFDLAVAQTHLKNHAL
jgi:2-C-methyl-D-erythritol 4-phosphate cytidylyltransferase